MARYADAIYWIASNDDTDWVTSGHDCPSVTASLVADLFGKDDATVRADIERELRKLDAQCATRSAC